MDMAFAQLTCQLLGLKLQAAAKLEEDAARLQLNQVAKEIRESLITLGLRKRKVRKPKTETADAKPKQKRK